MLIYGPPTFGGISDDPAPKPTDDVVTQRTYASRPEMATMVNAASQLVPAAGPQIVSQNGSANGQTDVAGRYPTGTVHYFDGRTYYVAVPKTGLGYFGQTHALETSKVDPAPAGSVATTVQDIEAKTGVKLYYPPGTVHYFDDRKGIYYVAVPKGPTPSLGCTHCLGQTYDLETTTADPTARGSQPTTASDVEAKTGHTIIKFYERWWFWALVAAGVIATGVGVYYFFIRKKD